MRKVAVLIVSAVIIAAFIGLLAWKLSGKRTKSTPELIADLNSGTEKDRIVAARLLQERKGDAAQSVPALIAALKDKDTDIRRSAAIGLGYFGEDARDAILALQPLLQDKDARVREAAGIALSRIDPAKFPRLTKPPMTAKK